MVNVPWDHERDAPYNYSEAGKEQEVEKERLRFEGDLDKWMKIIGAGITGYQPEAYTVMDAACAELVRLREDATSWRRIAERCKTEMGQFEEAMLAVYERGEAFAKDRAADGHDTEAGSVQFVTSMVWNECIYHRRRIAEDTMPESAPSPAGRALLAEARDGN